MSSKLRQRATRISRLRCTGVELRHVQWQLNVVLAPLRAHPRRGVEINIEFFGQPAELLTTTQALVEAPSQLLCE